MPFKLKKRWLLYCGVALLSLGVVIVGEVLLPRLFVVPHRTHYDPAAPDNTTAKLGLTFTNFDTTTADGLTLKGWFVPSVRQPAAGTVIILHGWGGSKEWIRPLIQLVVEHGHN